MTGPAVSGVSPFFIVADVPAALSFYRDMLGFEITFRGPTPDDEFFRIVRRGAATVMFKALDVEPVPNYNREPAFSWDAYFEVPDPDALAAEFEARTDCRTATSSAECVGRRAGRAVRREP